MVFKRLFGIKTKKALHLRHEPWFVDHLETPPTPPRQLPHELNFNENTVAGRDGDTSERKRNHLRKDDPPMDLVSRAQQTSRPSLSRSESFGIDHRTTHDALSRIKQNDDSHHPDIGAY